MANGADGCWSTEQIIADAGNWSLAGDVALLNNLKAFSEKVLNETVQISRNVDKLLDNVNDVGIRLDLAKNEFQSLRNSQFVESRVYEDDETIDGASKSDNKGEPADLTEDQKEMVIKQAIETGLKVMANYYDKVAITAATDVDRGYILQSKDSYAHRPLPYLVGSQEWYMKWHVGLLKTDIKESQKEDELPKDKALESHSGLDISSNHDEVQANAVSNETVDVNVNHTLNAPITNLTFAEQLTQKLSTVITSDINKNPIKQNAENKYPRSLFSDEPPPLDVTVLPKKVSDSDDNEQSGEKISASLSADEVDKDSDYYLRHVKRQTKGLFDETDESSDDEGDIFAKVGRPKGDKPFLQPFKSTTPFLDEEPPELNPKKKNDVLKKKPAGGVSILEEDFIVPFQKVNRSPSISSQEKKKNSSLFDGSSEDEFVTAIKPGSETSSFKNNDDPKIPIKKKEGTDTKITNNANFDSLEPTQEEPSREPKKKISLFDDDFLEDEDDIFGNIGAEKNLFKDLKNDMGQKHMLFEDSDELDDSSSFLSSSFQNKTLFEDLEGSEKHTEEKEQIMPGKIQRKDTISKLRKNCGLFDSSEDENSDEDIFIKKKIEKEVEKSRDMINKIENNVNLFEGTEDEDIFHKKINKEDSKIIKIEKDSVLNNKKPPIDESGKTANLFSSIEDEDSNKNVMPEDTKIDSKAKQATGLFSSDEDEGADDFTKKDEHDKDEFKPSVNLFSASGDGDDEGVFTQQVNSSAEGQLEAEQSNIRQVVLHKTDTNNRMKGPWQSAVEEKDNIGKQDQEKDESRQNSAEKAIRECGEITATKVMEQEAANFKTDGKLNLFTALHNDVEVTTDTKDAVGEDLDVDENGGIGGIPEIKVTSTTSDKPSKSTSKDSTKKSRVINLFDPTPPPDDNFWDNSDDSDLEGFSINDDFNREPTPRRGSSLFNNDPPSINPNDSSGIVRDQDSIRADSGEESFNPYASSTRKLSSDIFAEQQSEDGVFLTKEETENGPQPPSLPSIPEDTKNESFPSNFAHLTPSGRSEDLADDQSHSVFEKTADDANTSPSKLKHNLKINVDALLPHAIAPKLRGVVRSASSDEPGDPSSEGIQSDVGILRNVTKDRARIPVKRRPSTRKGRQEAIRNSVADFRLYHGEVTENDTILKNEKNSLEESLEDYNKKGISLVFGEESKKSADTILEKKASEGKLNLFGEEDSDSEDLFGAKASVKPALSEDKGSVFSAKSANRGKAKDSLFEDSDGSDDDDLFRTTKSKDVFSSTPVGKRAVKTAAVRKLENKEVKEDPLSLFQ